MICVQKQINKNLFSTRKRDFVNKGKYFLFLIFFLFLGNLSAISLEKTDSLLSVNSNDTAYVQRVAAKSLRTNYNWTEIIFKLFITVTLIVVLIYLGVLILKKISGRRKFWGNISREFYEVLATAPITFNKQFAVIRFGKVIYILALSEKEVSLIDKIDDLEEVAELEKSLKYYSNNPSIAKGDFSKVLKKTLKKTKIYDEK